MKGGLVSVALVVPKVTLLVDFTRMAFPVFGTEVGVLVVVVDMDETDDPTVVAVCGGCKEKSEFGARL